MKKITDLNRKPIYLLSEKEMLIIANLMCFVKDQKHLMGGVEMEVYNDIKAVMGLKDIKGW